jgi:hypothetical protein
MRQTASQRVSSLQRLRTFCLLMAASAGKLPFTQQILHGIRSTRAPSWDASCDVRTPECCRSPASPAARSPPQYVALISPRHYAADITPGLADKELHRTSIEPSSRLLHLTHSRTYSIASNPSRIRDVGSRTEIVSPACAPVIRPSSHAAVLAGRVARRGNARRVTGSTVLGLSNNLDLTFAFPRQSFRDERRAAAGQVADVMVRRS